MQQPRLWDIFCRVIDNFGDIGVCWRLAQGLAQRGEQVRLWIDDAAPLSWMAPRGHRGVQVLYWRDPAPCPEPGEVVIEAFGCDPPPDFVARMAERDRPPVWINLEHLSAETFVERSHGLPSPQPSGLTKWFFFPGFTAGTGGLIREPGLEREQAQFDRQHWLATIGAAPRPQERVVLLFCYDNPALPALLQSLSAEPTLLLLTPGFAQEQVRRIELPPALRSIELPFLDQAGFDRTLWSADLNIVRGEDSIVRAIWAGRPFIWHIYPQHDGAHLHKLEAFLGRLCDGADPALAAAVGATQRAFNGMGSFPATLPAPHRWAALVQEFKSGLVAQPELVTQLCRFIGQQAAARGERAPGTG